MNKLAMLNKDKEFSQYKSGHVVNIISPLTSQLRALFQKRDSEICKTCSDI